VCIVVHQHSGAAVSAGSPCVYSTASLSSFDAFVHFTHLYVVLVVCVIVQHLLVPPFVHFVVFVHVVIESSFDAEVLMTHFVVLYVYRCVVPSGAADSACSQQQCVLSSVVL
jgi:hypothetical protein